MQLLRLIQNEHLKVYKRMGTWIMISLLVGMIAVAAILTKHVFTLEEGVDWREEIAFETVQLESSISHHPAMIARDRYLEQQIAINQYRLEHDIPPQPSQSLWGFMLDMTTLTGVVSLFTIVIAGGMVANEFSTGTIKLLLIRPVSRSKILLSKYLTTLLFAFFLLALLVIFSFFIALLSFGYSSIDAPHLSFNNGQVIESSMLVHIISLIGFRSVDLIMVVTLAFMISTVFRSSSLAIGLSLFLMFTGPQVVQLLAQYDWAKFVLFANTDLMQYVNGAPLFNGMTMTFSVVILSIYFFVFIVITWVLFQKRDVAV